MSITPLPTPPSRADAANFAARADAFMAALPAFVTEANQLAADIADGVPIHAATAKSVPVDADEFGLQDSAATYGLKKVTLANLRLAILGAALSIPGGTVAASTPVLNATQTWDNIAVAFTGLKFNATDTASLASSLLADLQLGGTSKFSVRKDGLLTVAGGITSTAASNSFGATVFSGAITGGVAATLGAVTASTLNGFATSQSGAASSILVTDGSANLLLNTASVLSSARLSAAFAGATENGIALKTTYASTGSSYIVFQNSSGSVIGSVTQNGASTVAFNTSSDRRLKFDNGVATSTDVLRDTIVHDGCWVTDNSVDRFVFAQEAVLVKPRAVLVGGDELDENGLPLKPWGVDYSKYVPDLIVGWQQHDLAIQALKDENQSLRQQLAAAGITIH